MQMQILDKNNFATVWRLLQVTEWQQRGTTTNKLTNKMWSFPASLANDWLIPKTMEY